MKLLHLVVASLVMIPLRAVCRFVLGGIMGVIQGEKLAKLQRDIWRIDQKVNRLARVDSNGDKPTAQSSPFDPAVYPYLNEFPNPWTTPPTPPEPQKAKARK